jgi:hypothetical protein
MEASPVVCWTQAAVLLAFTPGLRKLRTVCQSGVGEAKQFELKAKKQAVALHSNNTPRPSAAFGLCDFFIKNLGRC